MALDISAAQARGNMAAVREQWVTAHLEQITAVISAASDSGEMAASYELQVTESQEAGLDEVMDALTHQGFNVSQRGKRLAVPKAVTKKVLRTAAGSGADADAFVEAPSHKEDVVLDISWADEQEVSDDASGFSLPRTPAPLI
ncbi:hypothetical protein AB8E26_01470 [Stenotrophomonas rhizophila]|uniref:hypothetical protein n=1 Tax=Stenotrophomonas rhizophila TaxID=216778 RepID=UPI0035135278